MCLDTAVENQEPINAGEGEATAGFIAQLLYLLDTYVNISGRNLLPLSTGAGCFITESHIASLPQFSNGSDWLK